MARAATTEKPSGKPRGGKTWKPGQSGNPNGRPEGSRHWAAILARDLMAGELPDIVRAVVNAAKGGDLAACKLVLERLVPVPRGRPVKAELPEVRTAAEAVPALSALLAHAANGEITPTEAQELAAVVAHVVRVAEVATLEQRIAALEARGGGGGA